MTAKRILKKVGCRASHKYKTQKLSSTTLSSAGCISMDLSIQLEDPGINFQTSAPLLVIKQASKQTFGLMKMSRESSKPKQMRLKQQVWHILGEKLFLCEEKLMPTKISVER